MQRMAFKWKSLSLVLSLSFSFSRSHFRFSSGTLFKYVHEHTFSLLLVSWFVHCVAFLVYIHDCTYTLQHYASTCLHNKCCHSMLKNADDDEYHHTLKPLAVVTWQKADIHKQGERIERTKNKEIAEKPASFRFEVARQWKVQTITGTLGHFCCYCCCCCCCDSSMTHISFFVHAEQSIQCTTFALDNSMGARTLNPQHTQRVWERKRLKYKKIQQIFPLKSFIWIFSLCVVCEFRLFSLSLPLYFMYMWELHFVSDLLLFWIQGKMLKCWWNK